MDKKLLLALLAATLEDKPELLRGPRGHRGPKGADPDYDHIFTVIGKKIIDEVHNKEFSIDNLTQTQKESLRLKFENLSEKEKEELKLKFSDLSEQEIESLRGPKGARGRDGKDGKPGAQGQDFDFTSSQDAITTIIKSYIDHIKDDLKLTFNELTDDELRSIRGPRGPKGQKGKDGQSFVWDDHSQTIDEMIYEYILSMRQKLKLKFSDLSDEEKDLLKLKFSDLTQEEIDSLRGKRGPRGPKGGRGQDGLDGKSAFELWKEFGNEGEINDFLKSLRGVRGLPGVPGPRGFNGPQGPKGEDGEDAPRIIDVEIKSVSKNVFFFRFWFDDDSRIDTNEIRLPKVQQMMNQFFQTSRARIPYDSLKPTYDVDCNLTKAEYYLTFDQIVANRVFSGDFTYTADNLTQELWSFYDKKDGITVLRTVTIDHTYDVDDMLTKSEITRSWA